MTPNRTALLAEADSIIHRSNYSREDAARVTSLLDLADSLVDKSELRAATMAAHARELGLPAPVPTLDNKFRSYLLQGKAALPVKELARIHPGREGRPPIHAQQAVGTGSEGGYLVPAPFSQVYETVLKQTDELFELATIFPTRTGAPTNFPLIDDTGQEAAMVSENTTSSEVDTSFAHVAFGQCPTWRSGVVRASIELAEDSAFPLEPMLAKAFATRMARAIGATFVSTLLTSATLGVTTASATAIAGSEVVKLTSEIDSAYLQGASWLMTRPTHIALLQLTGSSGNFLFPAASDAAGRPTILGFPVYFSPSMGPMTASGKAISFGRHDKFLRREVIGSLQVRTYVELYALLAQLAWECFLRVDGGLLQGSSIVPVAYLQMHS